MNWTTRFLKDQHATATVEYAVLLALIAAGCIGAAGMLGVNIESTFSSIADQLDEAGISTPMDFNAGLTAPMGG